MDFRDAKRNRRFHAYTLVILLISLFLGFNYLASKMDAGIDLTRNRNFTLSRETMAWLQKVDRPTDIIITIRQSNELPKIVQKMMLDLKILLNAFENADSAYPIKIHNVNIDSLKRDQELIEIYQLDEPNQIIIASHSGEDIRKKVLFSFKEQPTSFSKSSIQAYESSESLARNSVIESNIYTDWKKGTRNILEPTAFNGEEIILQGLLSVSKDSSGPNVVYFTTGHGENEPSDVSRENGYSHFQSYLEGRDMRVRQLSPDPNTRIPEDAALVVIASPQVSFREQEVTSLRSYTSERNGNLLIMLDPIKGLSPEAPPTFGLRTLLKDWNLRCHDMLIQDPDRSRFDIFTGDYAIRTFHKHKSHQAIHSINQLGLTIYTGNLRPVEYDQDLFKQVNVKELFYSSRESWAVSNWSTREKPFAYIDIIDRKGPVPVGALAEKKSNPIFPTTIAGGKVAVLGSSKFFTNRILKENPGNRMLLRNLIYWFKEESEILSLQPKDIHIYTLKMNEEQFNKLLYSLILIPISVGILGLMVRWLRLDN